MVANSSSDAASVFGGKNSKLKVVGWAWKMSRMCMAWAFLRPPGTGRRVVPAMARAIQDNSSRAGRGISFRRRRSATCARRVDRARTERRSRGTPFLGQIVVQAARRAAGLAGDADLAAVVDQAVAEVDPVLPAGRAAIRSRSMSTGSSLRRSGRAGTPGA